MRYLLPFLPIGCFFLLHYASANAYASVCAPLSFQGLIASVFTTASPVCNALLGVMNYTSNNYTLLTSTLIVTGLTSLTTMFTKPRLSGRREAAAQEAS